MAEYTDPVLAYFITFSCYGSWLHGDARGSVDRKHHELGTPLLQPDEKRREAMSQRMDQPPYSLDADRRRIVLQSIVEVCRFRHWHLLAAHVRSTHVHVVVHADETPERVMTAFKAYASRQLNALKCDPKGRKRWTRHGSTLYLKTDEQVSEKVRYVIFGQGEAMAVYPHPNPAP
jgi:REP element-mobilizing transposase RayT